MKNIGKRILAAALFSVLAVSLTACGSGGQAASSGKTGSSASGPLRVGVIQFAPHPSLDNCYKGFIAGLEEAGYKDGENIRIDFQNAQGEASTADLLAKNMVTSQYSLILGIATPAAMSVYGAAKDTDIPVVFSAVSDPLAAGIVTSLEAPGTNCTGTSDVLNLEAQMKMIRAFLPNAKTIGILYTTSEPNSISQLGAFKELAPEYGFEIVEVGIAAAAEVQSGAAALVSKKVDCINNFTDNNVVNNLSTLLHEAGAANIPVFGSEVEQVKNGCVASESIDYIALGRQTGEMAAKILSGEAEASALPVRSISDSTPVYNSAVCRQLNIALPPSYGSAEDVAQ